MGFTARQKARGLLVLLVFVHVSSCPNDCSFKGKCNIFNQCECFAGFTDADCSRRTCRKGPAWTAPAVATDSGHQLVECSNAGLCNRHSGECKCFDGFVGGSCERFACPATAGVECGGHGKCLSMKRHAQERANHKVLTYGKGGLETMTHSSFLVDDEKQAELGSKSTPLRAWYQYNEVWDASMVHGCVCDYPWTGYDCSRRECPRGDDPLTTGQDDAVQLVECGTTYRQQAVTALGASLTAGSFALQYGFEATRPMPVGADGPTVAQRLQALEGVEAGGVAVSEGAGAGGAGGDHSGLAWNFTFDPTVARQSPLVPLFKRPEVQVLECAADQGTLELRFPAPMPARGGKRGSAFTKVCLGGPKAGLDCAVSSDCVGGLRTGEGAKCGPKGYESVPLRFDASPEELAAALEGFSLVDTVAVSFTADQLCAPAGNAATVTFLKTRLDASTQGDLPTLEAVASPSLRRKSVPVKGGQGAVLLTPRAREAVKGIDTCVREEVQQVSCRARGGSFRLGLRAPWASVDGRGGDEALAAAAAASPEEKAAEGAWAELAFDATEDEFKAALEGLPLVANVSVSFAPNLGRPGGGAACGADAPVVATVTFHSLEKKFEAKLALAEPAGAGGDVPPLHLHANLTHPSQPPLLTVAEVVKGSACEPLAGATSPDPSKEGSPEDDDDQGGGGGGGHGGPRGADLAMQATLVHPHRDGGGFALSFLGEATEEIDARATSGEVAKALNALPSLRGRVAVSFSGTHACERPANVMAVTFLGDFGVAAAAFSSGAFGVAANAALPPLALDRRRMPPSAAMAVHTDGARDSSGLHQSRASTKENAVCSDHGLCDDSTGACDCFTKRDFGFDHAFASSDGRGGPGTRGDCGYPVAPPGDPRHEWQVGGRGGGATLTSALDQARQMVHTQSWGQSFPTTDCPGLLGCSGHGHCSGPPAFKCACAEGWAHAADCSERQCPRAPAWFDYPTEPNRAHDKTNGGVECGGRGHCDRETGSCDCMAGFTGSACELTVCPGRVLMEPPGHEGTGQGRGQGRGGNGGGKECSGHGRCLSMKQLALLSTTPLGEAAGLTYGSDPNNPYTWDADRLRGCACDEGWTGADCSERTCPFGDDPNTHDDVDEVQVLNCTATGGTFTLTFRGLVDGSGRLVPATTPPLAHNAPRAAVQAALSALPTVGEAVVTYSAEAPDSFCTGGRAESAEAAAGAGGERRKANATNVVSVRFVRLGGALPPLRPDTSALVDSPDGDDQGDEGGAGSGRISVATGGASVRGVASVKGTREAAECSRRGVCNRRTGVCECFPGYASGDARNGNTRGTQGDCGYLVGDRLLRAAGGAGDSDPARGFGFELGGEGGDGAHGLGGAHPRLGPGEKPLPQAGTDPGLYARGRRLPPPRSGGGAREGGGAGDGFAGGGGAGNGAGGAGELEEGGGLKGGLGGMSSDRGSAHSSGGGGGGAHGLSASVQETLDHVERAFAEGLSRASGRALQ